MHQLQCDLHKLPISLILLSDGTIAFIKLRHFKTIFDYDNQIVISEEDIIVKGEDFMYNVQIELTEDLREYLKWLELDCPW